MKKYIILPLLFMLCFPYGVFAVSGTNTDEIYVEIKTKQGDDWFTARNVKTDDDGVLRLKDVLPGKYTFLLDDDDDKKSGQTLGLELRMKDEAGKDLKEETDIDAYVYIGDMKVFVNTYETDDDGWVDLSGITFGTVYELDVKGDGKVKSKDDLARLKIKAKIDDSEWFYSNYERLDTDPTGQSNGIFEMKNVLSGKYKFKLKSGDPYDLAKPFTVKAQMRRDNGKRIKKPTPVHIYAYPFGVKTKVAEIMSDDEGWIMIPGAQPGEKYRLKVKD
jgi:5-hydroxyisourate hydrolase-like protein (transthyretin family)